jgi:alkanesulfonate monooxygenase SsuD/methylene tetrahydromethanopterin reductase-like flavin-dependent oxidoreductase (luciferase family)
MRVGVSWFFVPPAPFDPDVLAYYAKEADRLGFDVLSTPEHVAFPQTYASKYPYSADGSFFAISAIPAPPSGARRATAMAIFRPPALT